MEYFTNYCIFWDYFSFNKLVYRMGYRMGDRVVYIMVCDNISKYNLFSRYVTHDIMVNNFWSD
jgi:hypothetical protein